MVGPADCPVDCTVKKAQSCAVVGVSVALGDGGVEFPVVPKVPSKIPPMEPATGPERIVFAGSEVHAPVRVPAEVTGEPEIENCGGSPRPTLETVPEPPGSIAAVIAQYEGVVGAAVQFPKTVFAAALESANDKAGAVVEFATEVVKSGERFPALNEVTIPLPETEIQLHGGNGVTWQKRSVLK